MNADQRLLFWNEQAAMLFDVPALMADEMPNLVQVLTGVRGLTVRQRDEIAAFAATYIAAGDRTEPESCLRIALDRDHRIAIQVQGIGSSRWMLIIQDARSNLAGHRQAVASDSDAWLDALTGLANRRHFKQAVHDRVEKAAPGSTHSVLLIDLDRFNTINDTLGHPVGQALLCLVAQRLRRETRENDVLARLGGDQFAILTGDAARVEPLARRLVEMLSRPFLVEGHIVNIGASVGIKPFSGREMPADDVMREAELALRNAKSSGRGTWRVYDSSMAADGHARQQLESGLRKALALGEFSLVYQPQLDISSHRLTGFEALPRWSHPALGEVPSTTFLPIAEEIGCIASLGEWTLKSACQEAARWPAPLSVSVTVSPPYLRAGERLAKGVRTALLASGLAPERLQLEIAESALAVTSPNVVEALEQLHRNGVRLVLDAIGVGCSTRQQLPSFSFDRVKIDQNFVADFDAGSDAVIGAIAAIEAGPGLGTMADGIEAADQAAQMRARGSTSVQEFPLGQPIPSAEIDAFLSQYETATEAS